MITPDQVAAWVSVAQTLIAVGTPVVGKIGSWIRSAHPALTPEEEAAVVKTIFDDAGVREAFALRASGE